MQWCNLSTVHRVCHKVAIFRQVCNRLDTESNPVRHTAKKANLKGYVWHSFKHFVSVSMVRLCFKCSFKCKHMFFKIYSKHRGSFHYFYYEKNRFFKLSLFYNFGITWMFVESKNTVRSWFWTHFLVLSFSNMRNCRLPDANICPVIPIYPLVLGLFLVVCYVISTN